jgi:Quinohemoprotein amine dehydrogenase, gamma subunit
MDHVKPLNQKAKMIEAAAEKSPVVDPAAEQDVHAMQQQAPQPLGCALIFDPGWETDSTRSVTGLCQPVEADLYGCYDDCWWPAQVPDQLVNHLDWSDKCAAAERDWRKLDLLLPEEK